jgi:glycerol-3-phosphate dehydrogenase (NAD(P)+)
MRSVATIVAGFVEPGAVVLSVAKGLEAGTFRRMTEVLAEEIPANAGRLAALSGPNLALEIARGLPAAAVVAAADDAVSGAVLESLGGPGFRLYRNRDVVGVELAGALKNVIAIAAGAAEQLGVGDNAKAGLVTRGLAEMTRLGVAAGAHPLTFAGLAGLGDIIATCWSPLSRNHRLGAELAAGRRWAEIEATLPGVAEGAYTVVAALALGDRLGVELPIASEVHAAIYEGKPVGACIADLMARSSKDELESLGAAAGMVEALEASARMPRVGA